jgi:hypothetical protein
VANAAANACTKAGTIAEKAQGKIESVAGSAGEKGEHAVEQAKTIKDKVANKAQAVKAAIKQ